MDDTWTTRVRTGYQRDLDYLPGPRTVSFAGLRFRVDRASQYVSWMGWGLYLGFDRDMGMSLWDVRFRGERILYEVRRCIFAGFRNPEAVAISCPRKKLLLSTVSQTDSYTVKVFSY